MAHTTTSILASATDSLTLQGLGDVTVEVVGIRAGRTTEANPRAKTVPTVLIHWVATVTFESLDVVTTLHQTETVDADEVVESADAWAESVLDDIANPMRRGNGVILAWNNEVGVTGRDWRLATGL